jgi:hypothetical protein
LSVVSLSNRCARIHPCPTASLFCPVNVSKPCWINNNVFCRIASRAMSQIGPTNVFVIAFAREITAWWTRSPSLVFDLLHYKFVGRHNRQLELGCWFNHLLERADISFTIRPSENGIAI